jgi:hypothetical protein
VSWHRVLSAFTIATLLLAMSTATEAGEPQVDVALTAHAAVISQATWFRKGAELKCGFGRPASRDASDGTISASGDVRLSTSGESKTARVPLVAQSHGHGYTARVVTATASVEKLHVGHAVTVRLEDWINATPFEFDNDGDCGHTAGRIRPSSDGLQGSISVTVPTAEGTRAFLLRGAETAGRFTLVTPAWRGTLHEDYRLRPDGTVVWVTDAAPAVLDFRFDDSIGRSPGTSTLRIDIVPLGMRRPSLASLRDAVNALPRSGNERPVPAAEMIALIDVFLAAVDSTESIDEMIATGTIRELYSGLEDLFRFEVWPDPGRIALARDLKVSARLLGFQLGKRLLSELTAYCAPVRVIEPTSGRPFTASKARLVAGVLRAADAELRRFPMEELVRVTTRAADAEAANAIVAEYFVANPDGLGLPLMSFRRVLQESPSGPIKRELTRVASDYGRLAASQDEVFRLHRQYLFYAAAGAGAGEAARNLERAAEGVHQSVLALQSVLDDEISEVEGFLGRLFVTDAHMVRLVQGVDVDPYLAAVTAAYEIDEPTKKLLATAEKCLTDL